MAREEWLTLNRLRHRVVVWDGPAPAHVVLVHGWLDLGWSFAPFAEALQRRWPARLVAPDLRGHGASGWVGPGGYYHFADYVADLHALLTQLPGPRFVVGHSMGGVASCLLAGSFPGLVDRLVVIEGLGPPRHRPLSPPERMERWVNELVERRRKPLRRMTSVEEAAERLRANNSRLSPGLARLLAEKGTRPHPAGGLAWSFDPLHKTHSPAPFSADEFRLFLRRIACPTLLVEGEHSPLPATLNDGRESELRQHRRIVLPDSGHMVHHDQPELLAQAVAEFFTA